RVCRVLRATQPRPPERSVSFSPALRQRAQSGSLQSPRADRPGASPQRMPASGGVRLPRRPGTRHPLAPPAPPRHARDRALPRSGRHARVHRTEGVTASVVIPTRNRRATLAALLERVAPQAKAAGAEVVAVDNGSTDGTPELLRPLEAQGQLRVILEPTPGATRAARGDVLAFIDDDALPSEGWLAALLAPFEHPRVAAAGGRVRLRFAGTL